MRAPSRRLANSYHRRGKFLVITRRGAGVTAAPVAVQGRLRDAKAETLQDERGRIDPAKAWAAMMKNEKPGGHGERSVAVGVLDMALWDAVAKADDTAWVYAAGGYCYPDKDISALQDEMKRYLDRLSMREDEDRRQGREPLRRRQRPLRSRRGSSLRRRHRGFEAKNALYAVMKPLLAA